jgi:nucleoside-diphosphate-sugar epimerase
MKGTSMRTLVTGASGFLGSRIAAQLLQRGHSVRALVRKTSDLRRLAGLSVDLREGDVVDRASVAAAVEGVDVVFHSAAVYEIGTSDENKMTRVNVEGTRHVLEAARDAGALAIHVSSVAALGPTGTEPRDEGHWTAEPAPSPYARTKRQAHELAQRLAREGARVRIALPSTIYGPDDPSLVGRFHRWWARGLVRVGALGDMKMSLVHVDDCAAGVVRIAEAGLDGESYVLAGQVVTVREWLEALARVTRRKAPRAFLPERVVRGGARIAELAAPLAGVEARVVREGLALSTAHWAFTSGRARRELGFEARPLETGLAEVMRYEGALSGRREANVLGFSFEEVMEGTLTRPGERFDRPFRFEFRVCSPTLTGFFTGVKAEATGSVRIDGLAKDAPARGTLELSPFRKKTMRYDFDLVGKDGKSYRFEGQKMIRWLDAVRSWTTLPGIVYDEERKIWGTAILRFEKRHLRPLLRSIRFHRKPEPQASSPARRGGTEAPAPKSVMARV